MKATIKNGKLIIEAELSNPAPRSKSGKTRVPVTTNGFIQVKGDDGKEYSLSVNLTIKD